MSKVSSHEMLDALKDTLRDLERVRMTAPDDPALLALKQQIQKMIERSEGAANEIISRRAEGSGLLSI